MFEDRRNDSRKGAKIAKMDENSIGKEIVDTAVAVHRVLGPGLLETVYEIVPEQKDPWDLSGFAREKQIRTSHFSGRSTAAEFKRSEHAN